MSLFDTYKTGVDNQITNQTALNSIPPAVVGQKFKDLADLVTQFMISTWSSTYPNGTSTGYPSMSIVVYGNSIYQSLIDGNRDTPGTGLYWSTLFSSTDPTFDSDIPVRIAVGKTLGQYINGDTIPSTGKTPQEVITLLATEVVHPTYIVPTATLNSTPSTGVYYEVAQIIPIALSLVYNNDSLKGGGSPPTGYLLKKNGSTLITQQNYTDSVGPTVPTNLTYNGTIDYPQGPIQNNNLGVPDSTGRINAGTTSISNSVVYQFIYPWFFGTSSTNSTSFDIYSTGNKSIAPGGGTLNPNFNATSQFIWFAHDANLPDKTTWFVTNLNNGSIGGSSNLFASPVTVTVNGTGWSQSFKIYMSNYVTTVNNMLIN